MYNFILIACLSALSEVAKSLTRENLSMTCILIPSSIGYEPRSFSSSSISHTKLFFLSYNFNFIVVGDPPVSSSNFVWKLCNDFCKITFEKRFQFFDNCFMKLYVGHIIFYLEFITEDYWRRSNPVYLYHSSNSKGSHKYLH